ncbi:hypothetical protein [Sulfurospirillum sp. 1612]|uniref:hypothetical protein n=1 Tax=Sulfurospirillum sp. 1612 TaxID=3094835 RepID=UPI002F922A5D
MIIEILSLQYDMIQNIIKEQIEDRKGGISILKGEDHFYGNDNEERTKRIKELKKEIKQLIELRRALKRGIK